jgi:hypothetical protein
VELQPSACLLSPRETEVCDDEDAGGLSDAFGCEAEIPPYQIVG